MKITAKDLSTIHRMLGVIEGASAFSKASGYIGDAVATIDELLDKFEVVERSEYELRKLR